MRKNKTGLTENVAEEHSTGDPAAGKIIFLPIYFVIRKIRKDCNTNMITRENIHTLGDLLETAAVDYENQVFVRYEKDGIVYEKG